MYSVSVEASCFSVKVSSCVSVNASCFQSDESHVSVRRLMSQCVDVSYSSSSSVQTYFNPSVYPNDPHSHYITYWNQREWSIETTIVISVFGNPAGNAAVLTRAKSLAYAATQWWWYVSSDSGEQAFIQSRCRGSRFCVRQGTGRRGTT